MVPYGDLGEWLCQRSVEELRKRRENIVHFPKYHVFVVARVRSRSRERQLELDKTVDHYVRPSARILELASSAALEMGMASYVSVHVRQGDFLTEAWARAHVMDIHTRADLLFKKVNSGTGVYIATDADAKATKTIAAAFHKAGFQTVFTKSSLLSLKNASLLTVSLVEQVLCCGATYFDGQPGSTW